MSLKFLLLLLCKQLGLRIWTFWLFRIVPQQSHTILSICLVHYVSHIVSQFELFIHVFGHCWYQHWWQVLLSTEVFCCNDRLIPQSAPLIVWFWSKRMSFLSFRLNTVNLTSKQLESFLDQENNQICLDIFQSPHKQYKLIVQGSSRVVSHGWRR